MTLKQSTIILLISLLIIWFSGCDSEGESQDEPRVTFTRSSQEFSPARTCQIALGDVDGDGDLDAALANMGLDGSQLLLNDGTGRFNDSGQGLTPQGHGVDLQDLDGDGDLDLFFVCADYEQAGKVYLNDGAGGFQDHRWDLDDAALPGNDVQLFDADGDGDPDALIAYYEEPDRLYQNDGEGHFTYEGQIMPESATVADLDSDGDDDLFVKVRGQGYKTMLNDGQGNFSDHWQTSDSSVTYGQVGLGDFDHDGDADAFVANGNQTDQYPGQSMLNDGTGRFADNGQELSVTIFGRVHLGDLDGDGHLDAFISNFGLPNEVWLGDGSGRFSDSGLRLSGEALNAGCALGDLDGDGDLDIFVGTFVDGPNEIWFNDKY